MRSGHPIGTRALAGLAFCLLALSSAEGAAPKARQKPRPKPPAAMPEAPAERRVALVAPEHTGPTKSVVAKVLQAAEADLAGAGFQALSPEKVAAAYRGRGTPVPYCLADAPCLSKIGQAVGAKFVIAVIGARTPAGVDVDLTTIDTTDGSVVSRASLPRVPETGDLPELPHPAAPIRAFLDAKGSGQAARPPPGPDGDRPKPEPSAAPGPGPAPTVAVAQPPARSPDPGAPAPQPKPKDAPTPAAVPPAPAVGKAGAAASKEAGELLAQARLAYEALDFDRAAALATRVLAVPGLDTDTRLDAYLIQASGLAIAADTQASEVSFRLLLRARPDFELPKQTSPRILGVFRKVQAEERAIAEQVSSVARRRLVEGLQLVGEPPSRATGGRPLPFSFRLRDPTSAVTAFEVPYRRHGEGSYSVLALQRDPEGAWKGAIPSEWTASEAGFELEYYLLARDESGPLLGRGEALSPLRLPVSAGQVERALPRPVPRWALFTLAAGSAAAAVAAGGLGLGTWKAQTDYDRYAQQSVSSPMSGATLNSMGRSGHALSDATVGMAIATGVLVAATLALWPFTAPADPGPEPR